MYRLLLRSCKLMGVFVISPLPSFLLESLQNSRAPLLHGHYAASLLLRARPPPSRLPPFSWVRQLYGFLASATFMTGRGGLLQLLNMSLSPCYPYHPAGVSCRIGQPAPCHAALYSSEDRTQSGPWIREFLNIRALSTQKNRGTFCTGTVLKDLANPPLRQPMWAFIASGALLS